MSNKYRQQVLPTEVDTNDKDYIFLCCGGDSLGHALASFNSFKRAKEYLINMDGIKYYSRYSISAIPLEADLEKKPYFTVFYDDKFKTDNYNKRIEKAMNESFD